jgi:predicted SAM-dependent methyltransferase
MSKLPYLNLGCGITFDERWTNIDFGSTGPAVMAHNLLEGIPCADSSFEVVYHSHMLEHFPKDKAPELLHECYRVLKPGGIIRVVIPDLEQAALNYIQYMRDAIDGKPHAKEKYEWAVIELFDQMVRNSSGGEMLRFIADRSKGIDDHLLARHGNEMERLFEAIREGGEKNTPVAVKPSVWTRGKNKIKRVILQNLLGKDYALLTEAQFRHGGEIHQWMYDRYSLGELLKAAGFKDPKVQTAFESAIPDWKQFALDGKNGIVRKPDSLFMEARK